MTARIRVRRATLYLEFRETEWREQKLDRERRRLGVICGARNLNSSRSKEEEEAID